MPTVQATRPIGGDGYAARNGWLRPFPRAILGSSSPELNVPSVRYVGIPADLAATVRATMRSAQYPHPVHAEVAAGYGPCRECLGTFRTGEEERLLFTYQPFPEGQLPAPGPVFIHRESCSRYESAAFPERLRAVPLVVEGFDAAGSPVRREAVGGGRPEAVVERVMSAQGVAFGHLRNAEAGCFIARIERA